MDKLYRSRHEKLSLSANTQRFDEDRIDQNPLILLQRAFGNRAVASVLDSQPKTRTVGGAAQVVVQRKKTAVQDAKEKESLAKAWNFMPNKSKLPSSLDEEEKRNLMLADLGRVYDTYLEKGTKYLSDLDNRRRQYQASQEEYIALMQPKRDTYDTNFANHYVSKIDPRQGSDEKAIRVASSGFVGEERPKQPKPNVYHNVFHFGNKTIHALDNYATKDDARLHDSEMKRREGGGGHKDIGLPNSEILWQQGVAAAKSELWFPSVGGIKRAKSTMGSITTLRRENIQNPDTRAVVFMAYPNGKNYWSEDMTWTKDTEDFKAVMGTPNAAAAIHMLNDHLDEMSHNDIGDVTATTQEHLVIRFS